MSEEFPRYPTAPNSLFTQWSWKPPAHWLRVTTIYMAEIAHWGQNSEAGPGAV
jgi:hypothetical protein